MHSHCFHALGGPEIAEANVEEWNRDNPQLALTPTKKPGKMLGEESVEEDAGPAKGGDFLLQELNRCRGRMLPQEMWPAVVRQFAAKWQEYKQENGLFDFCDLIDTCYRDVYTAPRNPSVIFADEAQDLNRMQLSLLRKWGKRAEYFIVVGDDDQASLPGSRVLTEGGISVPVEALDPNRHRIMSYDLVHTRLNGLRKGSAFAIQRSVYSGQAVHVRVAGRVTRTTHNHPWLFRWTESSREKHIVYLMRKGESFRVGWCKLIRADGSCHLAVRAYLERADAAWVLRVCATRSEASLWESYVAAEYGISTAVWRPMHDQSGGHYTAAVISKLFFMLGNQANRAARCLAAFGRDVNLPFYEHGKSSRYGARTMKTAACNLIAGVMAVPLAERVAPDGVAWRPIDRIDRSHYQGPVYGLSVPPDHTYVADGIVTHNCIYTFTGSTPDAILDPDIPDDHKIILKQSYRVPRAVHALADRLIRQVTRRQEKVYLPRPEDGSVERLTTGGYKSPEYYILKTAEEHLAKGKTIMFLGSCSYMLRPVVQVLRKNGIPFHNPYRNTNGFWNPLRVGKKGSTVERVLALLVAHPEFEGHRPWTHADLVLWAELLASKGVLKHGIKAHLHSYQPDQQVTMERLVEIFEPAALDSMTAAYDAGYRSLLQWWRDRVTGDATTRVQYPADIVGRGGPKALLDMPRVVVGTIHSVKGGQSDVVYLFPDISQAGAAQYHRAGAPRDSVIRLFYVGATRARQKLYLCQSEGAAIRLPN